MLNNPFSVSGKNILITGASSGIGQKCAIICSQMGANVIIIGRNEERLQHTFDQLDTGHHLLYIQDINNYEKIEGLISDSVSKVGRIDGFIHSAGVEMTLPLSNLKPSNYINTYSINFISGIEFIKHLSKKKYYNADLGASFVLISSIMGIVGKSAVVAYSASKGAIISSVKSLAVELANKNIRVNSICPGLVETEMINNLIGKLSPEQIFNLKNDYLLGTGETSDIAYGCIYLLSDVSKWITGTNLIIDGGYSAK